MRRFALLALALAAPLPAQPPVGPARAEAEVPVVAEARAFMAAYAEDLSRGDRAAIAARYDRRGAWLMGRGNKSELSHARLVATYAGSEWQPPAAFEWSELDFEPLGPDAIAIVGLFRWTHVAGGQPETYSYTGLLVRQAGSLRIRIEDENPRPPREEDN